MDKVKRPVPAMRDAMHCVESCLILGRKGLGEGLTLIAADDVNHLGLDR